jgi:hypothetical protein
MPTNLFHQLHILSQAITDFPMFHWFRVIGFSAAVGYALVWFATS